MVKRCVVVTVLLLICVSIYLALRGPDEYHARQVKGVPDLSASPQESLVLDFYPHIRFSKRPDETYPFPIKPGETGPVTPLYAGANQYPFYCMSLDSELGQPEVDNNKGWGVPVYDSMENMGNEAHIVGYSKDCSVKSRVFYVAEFDGDHYDRFETTAIPDSARHYYRVEQGTINRFIYTIVVPISIDDILQPGSSSVWNQKLIYQFSGGSGIGFRQGRARLNRLLTRRKAQLHDGYAVITSTGNRTSYTYNMLLAEDTARRVKKQFTSQYSEPEYTVGIGGSGGGLAQYLIAQNSDGILDALIPLYSYPDMVSQTLYGLDCDLFNSYYSYRSDNPEYWQDFENRQQLEGLNASNGDNHFSAFLEPINQLLQGRWPVSPNGNSECINGWFGLSTFVNNPAQGFLREFFADEVNEQTHWSYWQDMVQIYSTDEAGFAQTTWSNEGVQYGLAALRTGDISVHQFLHLNWHVGAWVSPGNMQPERLYGAKNKRNALWLSLWSHHNISNASGPMHHQTSTPALRANASSKAVEAAYRSGQIFIGHLDVPIIDVRHYLEEQLDMHHTVASFSARLRIQETMGHYGHHVIWIAHQEDTPVNRAFQAMDKWMETRAKYPHKSAWQTRPESIKDQCSDKTGKTLAEGENVWNGAWNGKPDGQCQEIYPTFKTSRIQAGAPWHGSVFKCHLMPVQQAIESGIYGAVDMHPWRAILNKIFPNGVCDYTRPDTAKPKNL